MRIFVIYDTDMEKYVARVQNLAWSDDFDQITPYRSFKTARDQAKGCERRNKLKEGRLEVHELDITVIDRRPI